MNKSSYEGWKNRSKSIYEGNMELIRKNTFKKSLRKILAQYPHLEDKILDMLDDFSEKLYDSTYFRKKFMI